RRREPCTSGGCRRPRPLRHLGWVGPPIGRLARICDTRPPSPMTGRRQERRLDEKKLETPSLRANVSRAIFAVLTGLLARMPMRIGYTLPDPAGWLHYIRFPSPRAAARDNIA